MESLHIKNFAGIRDVKIDIKEINVFIGPQGSGKSIIIKLLYFFKNFLTQLKVYPVGDISLTNVSKSEYVEDAQYDFLRLFPEGSWGEAYFEIAYIVNSVSITVKNNKGLYFVYSEDLLEYLEKRSMYIKTIEEIERKEHLIDLGPKNELDERTKLYGNFPIEIDAEKLKTITDFHNVIIDFRREIVSGFISENIFIPAGRTYFANIERNIFNSIKNRESFDPFIIDFGAIYERYKLYNNFETGGGLFASGQSRDFVEIANQILNSSYIKKGRREFLIHPDGRNVSITNASSGQQESLPLIIVLFQILVDMTTRDRRTPILYLEEPEAHLFPSAQKKIVQLIARTFTASEIKNSDNGAEKNAFMQFFITTHSPYILTSFNNLLQAGRLAELKKDRIEEINKIVPKQEQINPKNFSAYYIENGEAKSLIDESTGLISQTELDAVSDEIVNEFSQLLDIEF